MAGFAAIEIAQKVSYTWRTMNENWDEHFQSKEKVAEKVGEKVGRKNKKKSSNGRSANKG